MKSIKTLSIHYIIKANVSTRSISCIALKTHAYELSDSFFKSILASKIQDLWWALDT